VSSLVDPLPDHEPVEIQLDLTPAAPAAADVPPQESVSDPTDAAILAAIEKRLEPALARAISTLDLQARASMRQMRETALQRQSGTANPLRPEFDVLLDERLADVRAQWDVQLDGYLFRMEERVQRMEHHAAQAEQKLAAAQKLMEKALLGFSRQLEEQVNSAIKRATQIIAQQAALSVDHELLRLTENANFVARDVSATIEADYAKARAEMDKTLHSLLDELGARSKEQARLLAADARQRVASTLAALEAEHLNLCRGQMKSFEQEIIQAGLKGTAEFRQGLRSFFYSCLVGAVSAVEEHSKTTLDGLSAEPDPLPRSPE
jgi:hypothetical protein